MPSANVPASPPSGAIRLLPSPTPSAYNPVLVYLGRLASAHSRRTMGRALDTLADWLTGGLPDAPDEAGRRLPGAKAALLGAAWGQLRYPHTARLRAELLERYSASTANTYLSALRGVLKEAWRLGYLSAEDYQRAVDLPTVRAESLPAGRDLAAGEVKALLGACLDDRNVTAGVRDAAVIAVLYAGARRAEAAALQVDDYDPASGRLTIRGGKGRKERTTYVDPGGQLALEDWLALRGKEAGPLFLRVRQTGAIERADGRPLTAQAIYNLLRKRGQQAGLADFSPHDFRRTVIGDLLEAGVDIVTVARMMGHADVKTTRRYDRRPEGVKQAAASKLRLPYRRRRAVSEAVEHMRTGRRETGSRKRD